MLEIQDFLFENKPTRKQLLDYSGKTKKQYKICVYRNHSFELVENTISAYLDYAEIGAEFIYSDYDDSLSFIDIPQETDMLILWLDIDRYKGNNIESFLSSRLAYLTNIYSKPVLFVPFQWSGQIKNNYIVTYDMSDISQELGDRVSDARMEPYTGTRMSAAAITLAARQLGLNYIPAMLMPSLKAVAVDLDNTLYKGVLGEDGTNGIVLTEGHRVLQQKLHELSESGFFICVCSKNEEQDVLKMFEERKDFPLKKSDISKMCVSWNSKADSIAEISSYLNIGIDSILFIDDNPGELNSVLAEHPEIHVIRAYEDAEKTLEVLKNYPRMKKLTNHSEDSLRKNDVIANEKRRELQASMSGDDYIRSLQMKLEFAINSDENAQRVTELSNKTNQFIFNYKRYQLSEIESLIRSEHCAVVAVTLSDKLSDSGIIGVCCGVLENDVVNIEECFVSCRALGRGIDECIVLGAIELICRNLKSRKIRICFKRGERNLPAERFLEKNFGYTENIILNDYHYEIPSDLMEVIIKEN